MISDRRRRAVITALGISQILSWGSSFYLLAVLAPFIQKDTGWGYDWTIGGVSVGLLIAGIVSPRVGKLISQYGGRPVLAAGSILMAAGLLAMALSPNLTCYVLAWAVIGVGMGASLYDAAFSALSTIYAGESRGPITYVTFFGGFASTVCWPLSALLVEYFGWRGTSAVYAAIHLFLCLPMLTLALPAGSSRHFTSAGRTNATGYLSRHEYTTFGLFACIVTIGAAILSIVATHLIPLLQSRGIDLATAVALGMIVGPAQVGARVVEMFAGRHYHPIWTLAGAGVLVALAAWMLFVSSPWVAIAIVLYGAGNGIGSVARGTVPLALFGAERYPVLMGWLALPVMIAMAIAPLAGGVAFQKGGADWTLGLLTGLGVLNVALVLALILESITTKPYQNGGR